MSTCLNSVSRHSRCYRVVPSRNRLALSAEQCDASSRPMTAFVRDFADAAARYLIAAPRQPKFDIWLFP